MARSEPIGESHVARHGGALVGNDNPLVLAVSQHAVACPEQAPPRVRRHRRHVRRGRDPRPAHAQPVQCQGGAARDPAAACSRLSRAPDGSRATATAPRATGGRRHHGLRRRTETARHRHERTGRSSTKRSRRPCSGSAPRRTRAVSASRRPRRTPPSSLASAWTTCRSPASSTGSSPSTKSGPWRGAKSSNTPRPSRWRTSSGCSRAASPVQPKPRRPRSSPRTRARSRTPGASSSSRAWQASCWHCSSAPCLRGPWWPYPEDRGAPGGDRSRGTSPGISTSRIATSSARSRRTST